MSKTALAQAPIHRNNLIDGGPTVTRGDVAAKAREEIEVRGARDHNLRDVSLTLPKNTLICFTGVSGSGKSTLAFDTLYAEGQRRYVESLSSYARQFMGQLPKPDVDLITGLAPSISIQQKSTGWNPRSTVGTITQIHDYARVLFARAGTFHCTKCGKPISAQTREQMIARILAMPEGTRFNLLAPVIRGQKGEYKDLFADLQREGYVRARVDGEVIDLASPPSLDRYKRHDIEVVIDRLIVRAGVRTRLAEALDAALAKGERTAVVQIVRGEETEERSRDREIERSKGKRRGRRAGARADAAGDIFLSADYACLDCGVSFEPPSPQMLSFNSPQGMCPHCDGMGTCFDFDPELLIPDGRKSFLSPCIAAWRAKPGKWRRHIYEGVARHLDFDLEDAWEDLPEKARKALLYGTGDAHITFEWKSRSTVWKHGGKFEGVIADLQAAHKRSSSNMVRRFYEQFMRQSVCPACKGARLTPAALAITLTGRSGHRPDTAGEDAASSSKPRGADRRLGASSSTARGSHGGRRVDDPTYGNLPDNPATAATAALNIDALCKLSIRDALAFFESLELDPTRRIIAEEPLKEIRARLTFLLDVGLDYLTLERTAPTLSGGESQRIRLASQIGCGLVGVLYVLDEPSIGLHPRDNQRLLASLQRLRDMGNTVIVVEHDRDTMLAADRIVDFGPGPGVRGGQIVSQGTPAEVTADAASITGGFLSGRQEIPVPNKRRPISKPKGRTKPAG